MAQSPRNITEVARPSCSVAVMPRKAPRMTMPVLTYSSGRMASLSQAAMRGKKLPMTSPGIERDDEAGLGGEVERPADSERLALIGSGGHVGPASGDPGEVAQGDDGEERRGAKRAGLTPRRRHAGGEQTVRKARVASEVDPSGRAGPGLDDGAERGREMGPDGGAHGPPEEVGAGRRRRAPAGR